MPPNDIRYNLPISIKLLGEFEVWRAGSPVPELTMARAEVLALMALSGDRGITKRELLNLLPSKRLTTDGLHRRVSDLRNKCGIVIQDLRPGQNRYVLSPQHVESIDVKLFVDGVALLPTTPQIGDLDKLMQLWRGDPARVWTGPLRGPWDQVMQARATLVEHLGRHSELKDSSEAERFASLFPTLPELGGVRSSFSRRPRNKPRLLVVEDQIMNEIREILDSEFCIVPVTSLPEWNAERDSLVVDGALIDLHLTDNLSDNYGTTVIAEHLRRHTEIPAALMSVAPPARYHAQDDLRIKYRLVDIVQKNSAGRLNGQDLLHVARELVAIDDRSRVKRLNLWIDCDEYHVKSDLLLSGGRSTRRDSLERCGQEAEKLRVKSRSAALNVDALHSEVMEFHRRWGPGRPGARY